MKRLIILSILSSLILIGHCYAQPSLSLYFTTAIPINVISEILIVMRDMGETWKYFSSPRSVQKPFGMGVSLSYFGQGLYFYDDPYMVGPYIPTTGLFRDCARCIKPLSLAITRVAIPSSAADSEKKTQPA